MSKPQARSTTPLTEDDLKAITDTELRQAIGYYGGTLANMRRQAEYYYLGEAKEDLAPPEIEGRSKVVSTDVRNTVESMLPALMAKFVSGDAVVEFEPTKEEDEQKVQTITDYINYLFFKKNQGHRITYTWFKDALLQKNGILKCWWDTRSEETREEYKALTDIELAQLMDDDEVQPIEHESYPDEEDEEQRQKALQMLQAQFQQAVLAAQQNPQATQAAQQIHMQVAQIEQTPPKMLHDVTFMRVKTGGKLTIENVPPEEFLISRKAKTIADAPFCAHRMQRTISELNSMGYDTTDIASDDSTSSLNAERMERLAWDDEYAYANADQNTLNDMQRTVWVSECYLRVDYDNDGISELRKITRAGNKILDNEVVDVAPFVSITPVPMPHKFAGLSIADMAMESQRQKTSMMRAFFDNLYLQVNGRYFAVNGQVNLDDLLTSRPGGVVRMQQPGMAGRLDQGMADGGSVMTGLEYMETFLENSTGWTRYSQGSDSDSLNKTATGVNIITNRADARMELVARNFSEGFVDLFRMMLKLVCQNQDKEEITRLGGNWVKIDPREWRNQYDVSINVGLGSNNKDQQAAHMMSIMQIQEKVLPIGIATPENVYNSACEMAKLSGFKSGDRFFTDPAKVPPKPPAPDPQMAKVQADAQAKQADLQANMQLEQQRMRLESQARQQEQQAQAVIEHQRNLMEAQRAQMEQQHEKDMAQMQAKIDIALEQARLRSEEQTKLILAHLQSMTAIEVAEIGAQTTLQSAQVNAAQEGADGGD